MSASVETAAPAMGGWLTALLATACGLIGANIYYAQTLVGPIGTSLGMSPGSAGLIVTLTQLGYGAGLLLIVPLGDVLETRGLVLTLLAVAFSGLIAAALASSVVPFLAACLLIGVGSVALQVLVPYAAHLSPPAVRGRAVGNVMGGLMVGIMLARPAASFVTSVFGWHAVFWASAVLMLGLAALLRATLPPRQPPPGLSYPTLIGSLPGIVRGSPVLRRRALYHMCMFGAFSLFWTTAPLLLARIYHLPQRGIALFALVGAAGVVAAPLAGRMADRGWTLPATRAAMVAAIAAWGISRLCATASQGGLMLLAAVAIVLDFAITCNFVMGQRSIFALSADIRSRLNGLYMSSVFASGAICSALGAWSFAQGGWLAASTVGLALPLVALAFTLLE